MSGLGILRAATWFSVGARRRPAGPLGAAITCAGAALGVYVVLAATVIIIAPWTLAAVFLTGMMAITFLTVGALPTSRTDRPSILDFVLCAASVAAGVFFATKAEAIVNRIVLLDPLTSWDIIFASAIFLLTLEVTRRTTGLGLTVVVLIFVAYNFFGHHLTGVLQHGYIDYQHFIEIVVFTTDGIMGLPVRVAATYAFMFVLFGTVLLYAKGGDFFYDLASALSGRQPGGPAKIAVVSSGLYGMMSGSPTADVVTTGSITIPIMKRLGYGGALAGAVEVAASTGGSLMPPVMGSAAFIMAEYTGIAYVEIAVAALLPALLYYLSVYAQVHFRSLKLGLRGLDSDQIPALGRTMRSGGLFMIPLAVLTVALFMGYTPTMVAVYGTVAVLAVAAVSRRTRVGLVGFYRALAETSMRSVPVAGATAAAGLVIAGITMTGLAAKFSHVIYSLTEADVFLSLVIAGGVTILFGMGMPTPSAYILAAVLIGPLFAKLQVATLGGHMFLLYYAVMSAITPPVAVAAFAASSIAEDNPLKIAAIATKLAIAAFFVPIAFVYGPELLLYGAWYLTVTAFATAAVGVVLIALAVEGFWRRPIAAWARVALGAAGLSLLMPWNAAIPAAAAVLAVVWFVPGSGLRMRAAGAGTVAD